MDLEKSMVPGTEEITYQFYDWPVAFGDLARLSREPEETL